MADGKQRFRLASLIQFAILALRPFTMGTKVGLTGDDDPDDRRTYPWAGLGESPDNSLFSHYQALATLRRQVLRAYGCAGSKNSIVRKSILRQPRKS